MAIIALTGAKGSPGVSTTALALALAWPLLTDGYEDVAAQVLVIEADAGGGSAVTGYLCGGVDPNLGLASLLCVRPDELEAALPEVVVEIEGERGRYLLPGLVSPQQMAAHRDSWPDLAAWLREVSGAVIRTDILLDVGRLGTAGEPAALLTVADVAVVVCRSDLPSVMGAVHAVNHLEATHDRDLTTIGCLLVGEGQPYSRAEVEETVEVPVAGVLALDPQSAAVFSQGIGAGRGLRRGKLMRSAGPLARTLSQWARANELATTPQAAARG